MKPDLILCLGNEILADDAFGHHVANELQACTDLPGSVDVTFAPVAGFHLLDLLVGRERVLIVDTLSCDEYPGRMHSFPMGSDAPSFNLTTSHQASLPTVLTLGKNLGMRFPNQIEVVAVEAHDLFTIGAPLSPAVAAAVPKVVRFALCWTRARPS